MPLSISIDDAVVQKYLDRYKIQMTQSARMMQKATGDLRDYIRETMQMQGRKRPWVPLSRFTMMRTGRRKPLSTLVKQVKSRYTATSGEVYFDNPKNESWTLWEHHKGFSIPPSVGRQGFYAARTKKPVFFMSRQGARVPAREIIPTTREVNQVVGAAVREWLQARR